LHHRITPALRWYTAQKMYRPRISNALYTTQVILGQATSLPPGNMSLIPAALRVQILHRISQQAGVVPTRALRRDDSNPSTSQRAVSLTHPHTHTAKTPDPMQSQWDLGGPVRCASDQLGPQAKHVFTCHYKPNGTIELGHCECFPMPIRTPVPQLLA
jgi:hypothetical protein